jgi:Cytochrome C'
MRIIVLLAVAVAAAEEPRPPERPLPPQPAQRPWDTAQPRHLPPPSDLSPMARQLLRERMVRHGKTMSDLVQSVIVLDYAEAARLSREIAEEPRLARPLSQSDLNAGLPERFFELQDELHQRANRLSEVARSRNGSALAPAFGQLAETCVSCHRVYSMGRTP